MAWFLINIFNRFLNFCRFILVMKKRLIKFSFFGILLITGFGIKDTGFSVATTVFLFFKDQVIPRLVEMVVTPFNYTSTLWLIIPLFITIFFIQLYFGRWKNEKLGWSSAFGNMIALLFISVNLLDFLRKQYAMEDFFNLGTPLYNVFLIGVVLLQIVLMMVFIYFHLIPKKLSFFISSSVSVNTIAFAAIVLVYGKIPIDWVTLAAFLLLYLLVQLFFLGFRWLIPPSEPAKRYIRRHEKEAEEEKIKKKISKGLKRYYFMEKLKKGYFKIKRKLMFFKKKEGD